MVHRGLSGFRPMDVILTQEKCLETRRQVEPLKTVNYTKFDAVFTIINGAAWSIGF